MRDKGFFSDIFILYQWPSCKQDRYSDTEIRPDLRLRNIVVSWSIDTMLICIFVTRSFQDHSIQGPEGAFTLDTILHNANCPTPNHHTLEHPQVMFANRQNNNTHIKWNILKRTIVELYLFIWKHSVSQTLSSTSLEP